MNNRCLEAALEYLERGWSVIPVKLYFDGDQTKAKKKPLVPWMEYTKRHPTREEVINWWTTWPDASVGIVTGEISNLVVLDLDTGYNKDQINELSIPKTVEVLTPTLGRHLYFKNPKTIIKNRAGIFDYVDVRGEHGFVVAPPSLYPNQIDYKWLNSPLNTEIQDLPGNLIKLFTKKPNDNFTEVKSSTISFDGVAEGKRNQTAAEISGSLIKNIAQALWDQEAWPKLQEWNQRNIPPLSDKELRTTFESICSIELKKRVTTLVNKQDIGEAIVLKDLLNKKFNLPSYVVHQLFETATINMISAAPNHYKSWVVQHIAISIASGRPAFNHFATSQQKVMIINEEDSERSLKERSEKLLSENDTELPIYFHVAKGIRLTRELASIILDEAIKKNIGFLVFDSLRSIHNADENNSKEMQEVMENMKIFSRAQITVLFTHHNRKKFRGFNTSNDQNNGEESRGSSSINAAIHGHISCEPKILNEEKFLLISQHKLKCDKKLDYPFKVAIVEKTDEGKIKFEYRGDYDGKIESRSNLMEEILAELVFSGWVSVKDLLLKNLSSDRPLRDALKALITQGSVIAKTRKDLRKEGISLNKTGADTEVFYSLPKSIVETDLSGY